VEPFVVSIANSDGTIDDAGSSAAAAAVGDIVAIRPQVMSLRSMRLRDPRAVIQA
jgi:hypothetical protein